MEKFGSTLIVSLCCLLQLSLISCELRFVHTMFRGGARAPVSGISEQNVDILGEKWLSPGELTPTGERMQYLLGYKNMNKYKTFLPSSFDTSQIYIKSTDYNRTMMSAQAQLNGMYSPGTGPVLTSGQEPIAIPPGVETTNLAEQQKWGDMALPYQMQVFPVHLWPMSNNIYQFFYDPAMCKPVKDQIISNTNNITITNYMAKFNSTWGEQLMKALGIDDKNYFYDYINLFVFFDTFIADYADNRQLSKLTNAGIDLSALNITTWEAEFNNVFYMFNLDGLNSTFARWSMSPLFTEVINFMDSRIKLDLAGDNTVYNNTNPKYVMHAVDDLALGSAQVVLKSAVAYTNNYINTPFASNLFFELTRTDGLTTYTEDDYSVNALYNDVALFTVPYTSFKDKVLALLLTDTDIMNYCEFEKQFYLNVFGWPVSYMHATVVLACILFVMVVLIVIYICWFFCCRKKNDSHGYEAANNKVMPTL